MVLKISNTKQEVAKSFSEYFREFVRARNMVHVALSGGSTPRIVFEELADNFKNRIPWEQVHFYWGDERCVPPSDEESNFKMTNDFLLSKIDIPEINIHRIKGENEAADEASAYALTLKQNLPTYNGLPRFDLVILGMGDDGHTASIFPDQIDLWDSENYCEVALHPISGQKRITITGKMINNAAQVVFLVTGEAKAEKVREIMKREGAFETYPAFLVAPESGELIWFLDREAGALIPFE